MKNLFGLQFMDSESQILSQAQNDENPKIKNQNLTPN